jgi:uncharacterized protein
MRPCRFVFALFALLAATTQVRLAMADDDQPLRLLFLGDNNHHRPADRFAQLAPVLAQRGIELKYTDEMSVLTPQSLGEFDGLVLYANIDTIEPEQAQAVLDFVAGGKAFVPLHCATYCWRNSPEMVALMGAQFQEHGIGQMGTRIVAEDHPIMQGFGGFTSFDETYLHRRHNQQNRKVLEVREGLPQAEGRTQEPWTWVRTHGEGRVFYTAWGHDHRTWGHPGFHNLIERGIRWACGDDPAKAGTYVETPSTWERDAFVVPELTAQRTGVEPFEYIDVGPKIPNYPASDRWGVQEAPHTQMQKPLPPEESVKHYVAPHGFAVKLWAAEDPIGRIVNPSQEGRTNEDGRIDNPSYAGLGGKPVAMNWDERGRLWVCETLDYPNELQPSGQGRDRIRICEDTDGDGQADTFTLFAENLSIPTAILPVYGGALVQNGTETLFLKDTDGDGKADLRQVLISGWELGDTHGGVSNFQYGLDNWIWAMQGYNNSSPVINGERQQSFRMGFFRFKLEPDESGTPRVSELEFLRSTNNNTWGLGFSEEGLVFGSTANRCPSVYLPIPNRYYERVRGWSPSQLENIADTYLFARPQTDRIRQVDQHGGYTAGAGHALYTARQFPQQWWNRTAFVCEPTAKLVGTFVITANGSDFHSTTPFNLIASDDEWSAPIMAEVGPDGAVWVLDWYNYIVQHNPTPQGFETGKGNAYESDLRDKKHGRIYRVVYEGDSQQGGRVRSEADGPASAAEGEGGSQTSDFRSQIPDLSAATPQELVETLRHPTMLWRKQAQRLLVERGDSDVVPQLIELIKDTSIDEIGLNVGAIHALWTLHGLGVLSETDSDAARAVAAALDHPSAGVRRNAVQVLPASEEAVAQLAPLTKDPDAQVRLAAVLALSDLQENAAAGPLLVDLLRASDVGSDRWITDAITSAAATHALPLLMAAQDLPADPGDGVQRIFTIVGEHIARGRPDAEQAGEIIAALAKAPPAVGSATLSGLSDGWPRSHSIRLSDVSESALLSLLERIPADGKGQLIGLASSWGSTALQQQAEEIAAALLTTIEDEGARTSQRVEAARQLIGFRQQDIGVAEKLLNLIGPQTPPNFAEGVISAVAQSRAEGIGGMLVERCFHMTPAARSATITALLQRPETTKALLDGISEGALQVSDLGLEQQRLLAAHPSRDIRRQARDVLASGGGLPDPDREKVLQALLPLTKQEGDARVGLAMFVKHCAKCHSHANVDPSALEPGTVMGDIGPNLTGMAVHPKAELLTHVIDPSRSVEGNFRSYTVVTAEGQVLTGMLASETRTAIELIDTDAKRHAIAREDIEELVASRKSVMPDGFEKQMSEDELSGLLEFLTSRGRYLPLDLRKVATIVSTRPMFYGQSPAERLIFADWGPKTFRDVPFLLVDPKDDRQPNVIMLHGPLGSLPPQMPRTVTLPVNAPAGAIHLLSGIGGWSHPATREESTSLIVRLQYEDGRTEDHELKNGVHFADYIRRVDVPESEFAFDLRGRQVRYLKLTPQRPSETIAGIEFVKGEDQTAPIVMAVTIEAP